MYSHKAPLKPCVVDIPRRRAGAGRKRLPPPTGEDGTKSKDGAYAVILVDVLLYDGCGAVDDTRSAEQLYS